MRLRAKVKKATGKTKHFIGTIIDGNPVPVKEVSIPIWVEIISDEGNFLLLIRYDINDECIADTWHQTLQEAKQQAEFEYEISPDDWEEISI